MHSIDIIITTIIGIFAVQIWTVIGYGIISCMDNYETTDSELLSCFFWPLIVVSWMNIEVNKFLDEKLNDSD